MTLNKRMIRRVGDAVTCLPQTAGMCKTEGKSNIKYLPKSRSRPAFRTPARPIASGIGRVGKKFRSDTAEARDSHAPIVSALLELSFTLTHTNNGCGFVR